MQSINLYKRSTNVVEDKVSQSTAKCDVDNELIALQQQVC